MRKGNIFNIVSKYWYIIDTATGKMAYGGLGFFDHDEAIMGMAKLIDANPDKEYELMLGGFSASEDDYDDPYEDED